MRGAKRSKGPQEVDEAGLSDNDSIPRDESGFIRFPGLPVSERPALHPRTLSAEETIRNITLHLPSIAYGRPTIPDLHTSSRLSLRTIYPSATTVANISQIETATVLLQECSARIQETQQSINLLRLTEVLGPHDLARLSAAQTELKVQRKQLDIYERELAHFKSPNSSQPLWLAGLVVAQQPFPKIVKQKSNIITHDDEHFIVRLLHGARTRITPMGPVKADLINDDCQTKSTERAPMENDAQALDVSHEKLEVKFDALRFVNGSRIKAMRVQFNVHVQLASYNSDPNAPLTGTTLQVLQSEQSAPFIVLTNENQWETAAGLLLQRELFLPPQPGSSPWPRFANVLQTHYINATRQSPLSASRPLSKAELEWIREVKFNSQTVVPKSKFDPFWEWFGKVMHKLRHQRCIHALWQRGFIFGFCHKTQADELLADESQGACLIRFAEHAGNFAIAYLSTDPTTSERRVKVRLVCHMCAKSPYMQHYLIKPEDLLGPHSTLPEFLFRRKNFSYVLKRQLGFDLTEARVAAHTSKADAFGEFLAPRHQAFIGGYEDQLSDRD